MEWAEFMIPAARLARLEEPWLGPLAIVRLDESFDLPQSLRMPPCPLVAIGSPGHPFATKADVILAGPSEIAVLARNILEKPLSAAVLVQLLRATRASSVDDALTLESMAYAMLQGSAEHAGWLAGRKPPPPSPPGRVEVERRGPVLHVTIDRAQCGNAIDRPMRDQLASALSLAAVDTTISRVRLDARGKAFSLGADLSEFGTTADPATAHAIRHLTLPARAAAECADRLEVHVDGACVGAGLEVAAFAARVTATPRSWFQLPELAMGIIPGAGGCVSLPRRIGRQRTALMVLSGRRIGAREALEWGLVDALVDHPAGDDGGDDIL